jgi:hypothetical protein
VNINTAWDSIEREYGQRVSVITNYSSISYFLIKDVQNYYIKGKKPNCNFKPINGDNLRNVRLNDSRHFRNKIGNTQKTK